MPVILRSHNISTDLKITNGAQGYLRFIQTDVDDYGYACAKYTVVEFPGCDMHLNGLPPSCFPIQPITWTFRHEVQDNDGKSVNVSVTREQMPFQAGFACTGQVAQGQTMPNVLAYMNEGGFAAYVAASRATGREGLYVAHPVQLEQLNQDLPVDLVREMHKFDAMAWNTLIWHGFRQGSQIPVEDTVGAPYLLVDKPPPTVKNPASIDTVPTCPPSEKKLDTGSKRRRQQNIDANAIFWSSRQYGCTWSQQDWSCAYDTVITSFLYVYLSLSDGHKRNLAGGTTLTASLVRAFDSLDLAEIRTSADPLNSIRDQIRDLLYAAVPAMFP
ncbi:uncharacterized protein ARMOST_16165 [Armillaria ostoyae]|uniref:Uncharacterized protein n=1 Tax=Armillaria ostoyae TaxID=47428 RepID=A0A284RVF7_ARMOS|nr:uncharacterized protein ARMOST_16165 [Armillaria ostoyae]